MYNEEYLCEIKKIEFLYYHRNDEGSSLNLSDMYNLDSEVDLSDNFWNDLNSGVLILS